MHDMTDVIRDAVRDSDDLTPYQKRRIRFLLMFPPIAAIVSHSVERKLLDDGDLILAGGSRWDPESWDWDKIVERIKDLTLFVLEVIEKILPLFI